jgi:hypothetical protein
MILCLYGWKRLDEKLASGENTVSTLGRFVLIIWLFVVLIITSSYTASLTSILTVQQLSTGITGIDSLVSSSLPIGYQAGKFTKRYLTENFNVPLSRLVPLNSIQEYADALNRGPKNGGVAAIVDEKPYIDIFLSNYCSFRIVGEEFTKEGWGFVSSSCLFSAFIHFTSFGHSCHRISGKHKSVPGTVLEMIYSAPLFSFAGIPERLPPRCGFIDGNPSTFREWATSEDPRRVVLTV